LVTSRGSASYREGPGLCGHVATVT